jgi:hypothetical protein
MQFFKASPKNKQGIRKIELPESPIPKEQIEKHKCSPTVKDRTHHELLLKDQIITVVEKYIIYNDN